MNRNRLEAISDGIFAIIITVMLLELKIPEGDSLSALRAESHLIFSYILSFIYVGIYWNNHHHLFQVVKSVNGKILWGNLHLMFWLTMIPLTTGWSAHSGYAQTPTALYAFILFMCSISYHILEKILMKSEGVNSLAVELLGRNNKLLISILFYGTSIFLSFIDTKLTLLSLGLLAVFWFLPNKKIEQHFKHNKNQ
ncbi:TMEM175 family protein [Acinetobacter rudis]|uniref:TMEM175 family protein n=1 Tax=Acinetobacter rudis TaxID=632955 RepID=A0AAW8J493_9GAMM|nr:TMEM175 family protein [Acinetobacter rudis]MDQ8934478.1 TMEM175 family protein [Acinetobacter rudis]MDQ8951827.1 TMEM175 family protein [Acinetobacter rudis]MDQ9016622.1 TMEM175 family protein [Acinetobacter rudis]